MLMFLSVFCTLLPDAAWRKIYLPDTYTDIYSLPIFEVQSYIRMFESLTAAADM